MKNIAAKLSLILICVAIMGLLVLSAVEYVVGQKQINRDLNHKFESKIQRLTKNLRQSVWEYNLDAIRDVVVSEFIDPSVGAVLIRKESNGEIIYGAMRNKDTVKEINKAPENRYFLLKSGQILYISETTNSFDQIGEVVIYLDRSVSEKKLIQALVNEIVKVGIIVVIMLLILSLIVNRLIVFPLEVIRKDMIFRGQNAFESHMDGFEDDLKVLVEDRMQLTFSELRQIASIYRNMLSSMVVRQKAVVENEKRYRSLFETANTSIFLMDGNVFVDCNPKTLQIFDRNRGEILQKTPFDFSPEFQKNGLKSRSQLEAFISKTIQGEPQSFEWQFKKRDDSLFDTEVGLNRVTILGEQFMFAFVRDVTIRKKAEHELAKTYYKLEESYKELKDKQEQLVQSGKMAALGILASGIAHEVAQPLMGISMGVERVMFKAMDDKLDNEIAKEKCNEILEYVARIKKTIEHVRVFSREQKIEKFNICDLNESIDNSLLLVKTQYKNHNIRIEKVLSPDLPLIKGNLYRLEQVILNLLANARDALDEKERKLNDSFEKNITISTEAAEHSIILTIHDNGTGIEPEALKRIFEPFYSTKSSTRGTGLGLSVTFGLVKEMNGEISAESVPMEYTCFRLEFPVSV